jgi:hypothetical protein
MALLVWVRISFPMSPRFLLAFQLDPIPAIAGSKRSHNHLSNGAFAVVDLPALAEHADTTRVLILDSKMIEDVPMAFADPHLPATQP